jgi:hypothetical protein
MQPSRFILLPYEMLVPHRITEIHQLRDIQVPSPPREQKMFQTDTPVYGIREILPHYDIGIQIGHYIMGRILSGFHKQGRYQRCPEFILLDIRNALHPKLSTRFLNSFVVAEQQHLASFQSNPTGNCIPLDRRRLACEGLRASKESEFHADDLSR